MSKDMKRDYDVGYGKPPTRTQFKPGQSGNRKGRRKKVESHKSVLREELAETFAVTMNGKTERLSSFRISVKRAKKKAMEGDLKAIDLLFRYCERWGVEEAKDALEQEMKPDDEAILNAFLLKSRLEEESEPEPSDVDKAFEDALK